jgi:type VI secretion system protein ImpL
MINKKALATAISIFLLLQAAGVLIAKLYAIRGTNLLLLFAGLVLLGALASALVYSLMRARAPAAPAAAAPARKPAADEVDTGFAAARARLKRREGGGAGLADLPAVLVLGPSGATKTTVVVHSGLDAELLAGEVYRGDSITPTGAVNLWYAQDLVLIEAGGGLGQEPTRWQRLGRQLRPGRWLAAVARRPQAPRAALVCFPCDAFLQPGAAQSVAGEARALRAQLAEVSRQLGVRLPVYALFTKADRLPYFEDYVRNLSREEAREVLGETLPVLDLAAPGVYAEQQSRRVVEAFRRIVRSLSLRRVDLLGREPREEVRAGAYEFPRELQRISDLATEFLVELCRPSQLEVSPFLRGFYFTGVRPVVVTDTAAPAPPAAAPTGPQIPLGATSVFSLQNLAVPRAPAAPAGTRRVPEWVFLRRLLRDVVLHDDVARRITGGGVRVNAVRRALLAAAALGFLLLCIGMTVSYRNNRLLQQEVLLAARGVEALAPSEFETPSQDALERLDALRVQADRLAGYERARRPWRLRWGLYTGGAVFPQVRQLYFDRFERLLWANSRTGLLASLRVLPDTLSETDEYGSIYNALKAHLITTGHPAESTPEFLTPVLLEHWAPARGLDAQRLALARRNFDFYAAELPHGNPYRDAQNEAIVTQTRSYLYRFASTDRFYQVLLAEAGRGIEPVRFHQAFPNTETVVRNAYEVPGAFTNQGYAAAESTLADVDRLFAREQWVVGERAVSAADRTRLASDLRERFVADYIRHWQEFLRAGAVVTGGGVPEIVRRLERLSGNQPPVLQMLALAARHTNVDTMEVARAFQPLHQVVPPAMTDRFIGESNAGYVQALGGVHDALAQAMLATGADRGAAMQLARPAVEQVRGEVRTISQGFVTAGPAAQVGANVVRLLDTPVAGLDALIQRTPGDALNAQGASFCSRFAPVLAKYPFSPRAGTQATVDDVMAAFQPGSSLLWAFYQDALGEMIFRSGTRYAARIGASPQPSAAFLAFFNQAAAVSRAMFDDAGNGPEVAFTLRPQTTAEIPEITVSIDGQVRTFTRTEAASQTFSWSAAHARGIRITGRVNGVETPLLEGQGTWGLFQVFQQASWSGGDGFRQTVQWRLPGLQQTLTAEVGFPRGVAIFNPATLGMRCVSQIAN